MRKKIKKIVKKYPTLEKYLRILSSRKNILHTVPKKIIKGTNNILNIDKSSILNNCVIEILGNNNEIEINASALIHNVRFYIRGDSNKITIGRKVMFNTSGSIWIEDYCCEAIIGDDTTFQETHIVVTEPNSKIVIGKDCMFAYDIDLRTGDSHSIVDSITSERLNYAQNISIGDHVWIAPHVSILKGVHISENSVVAIRAVVTKSFMESNILIGGVPAKKLKANINWTRKRIYK